MVKAELEYNPYLPYTKIRFNGNDPRINSMVEKYEEKDLREWIDEAPGIFFDEMNGYDFELEFSGTKRDYLELKKAFEKKEINSDRVYISHKNTLNGRIDKIHRLNELITWLKNSANDLFDFDKFEDDNRELFWGNYQFIVIDGRDLPVNGIPEDVSIEYIDDVDEIKKTVLTDIPILINITEENFEKLVDILIELKKRADVDYEQLFFLVDNKINIESKNRIARVIKDMGIENPQMVDEIYAEKVHRYMELYPYSDYIKDALVALKKEKNRIEIAFKTKSQNAASDNSGVHEQILEIDKKIEALKRGQNKFNNRDNLDVPKNCNDFEDDFLNAIMDWNRKTTKICSQEYAQAIVNSFERDVKNRYQKFLLLVDDEFTQKKNEIKECFASWYKEIEYDVFNPTIDSKKNPTIEMFPSFTDALLTMKRDEFVKKKEKKIEVIFNPGTNKSEMVLEQSYHMQDWREGVYEMAETITTDVIDNYYKDLCEFEKKIANKYLEHIDNVLSKEIKTKEKNSEKLTSKERIINRHKDWFDKFKEQLDHIERD